MNYNPKIKELLDKYFEGETTLEEEHKLKLYFLDDNVDESLLPYKPLFNMIEEESHVKLNKTFDSKLEASIKQFRTRHRIRRMYQVIGSAAAMLAILLCLFLYNPMDETVQEAGIDWSKYEPETPEEAFKVTRGAIMQLSVGIKSSAERAAQEMDNVFNKVK
ncbi:MAG: hypothetical protein AAFO07_23315 [Bacteroidota bacterium]